MVIIYNLTLYSPLFIFSFLNNNTNITENELCDFSLVEKEIRIIDLLNSSLVPFVLMFSFSVLLIHTIIESRLRILRIKSQQDRLRLRKDIQFAISTIALIVSFFLLNSPIALFNLFEKKEQNNDLHDVFISVFHLGLCINFYALFFFNSIFRKETLALFKIKK